MNTTEINKRFCELAGRHPFSYYGTDDKLINEYPDFCAHPKLVLEVMMKREDWPEFRDANKEIFYTDLADYVRVDYILNRTGQLALLAISWIEENK
jgi:hypothetical protein